MGAGPPIPIQPSRQFPARPVGHRRLLFAMAAILLFAAGFAHAQEGMLRVPDASYGDSATSYQSPTDLTMPTVDDAPSPDTVTIPIPGGGEITVDGPDAPTDTPLPNLPGSQWGVSEQAPSSHDIGPTLP